MIAHFLFEQQRRRARHDARVSQKRQRIDRFPPIVASAGWFCLRVQARRRVQAWMRAHLDIIQNEFRAIDEQMLREYQYGGMQ